MLKYITEEEYKKLLGTNSIPDNFNNLVIQASEYINRQTSGRIDSSNVPEKVKYVTGLITELEYKANNYKSSIGNLKSQNIEGWSESYATPEEIDRQLEIEKRKILDTYLWDIIGTDGKPLLYCGVYVINE